jgi:hypothetical protein
LAAVEKEPGWDEVPGSLGDDVGGEKIEHIGPVTAAVVVGADLTAVSGADAEAGGLDLDPDDTVAEVEGDVEGLGVSPRLEDRVTVAKGFGDELGFHPFAAFFVGPELGHASPRDIAHCGIETRRAKEKAQPMGRAFVLEIRFPKALLYIFIISHCKAKSDVVSEIFHQRCEQLKLDCVPLGY